MLRAIDPATGKIAWEYKNKAPLWGGVLTTAGNLVFTGVEDDPGTLQTLKRLGFADPASVAAMIRGTQSGAR